jgi:hypothetical protein
MEPTDEDGPSRVQLDPEPPIAVLPNGHNPPGQTSRLSHDRSAADPGAS